MELFALTNELQKDKNFYLIELTGESTEQVKLASSKRESK